MTPAELVARCKEVVALAKTLYGIDMSQVQIGWCKGRAAGKAGGKRLYDTVMSNYYVKFNYDMLGREAVDHVDTNTVPHEYAHVLGYIDPERFGRKHDALWAKTCKELGGNGVRCHTEEVVMGKGTTYEYTTTKGHTVRIGDRHHRKVQAGTTITFRRGKGAINQFCSYSIVGMNGRTLANPIVRQAVNHPAQIEAAVRAPQPDAAEMARRAAMVAEAFRVARVTAMTKPAQRPALVPAPVVAARPAVAGESKAAISRRIMLAGYNGRKGYETIIAEMIAANGYDRQLARATFKANAPKVGIPASFYS